VPWLRAGNAAVEISDDEDALTVLVRAYKEQVRKRLHALTHALGARTDSLGDALMLLFDGGYFAVFSRSGVADFRGAARGAQAHRRPSASGRIGSTINDGRPIERSRRALGASRNGSSNSCGGAPIVVSC